MRAKGKTSLLRVTLIGALSAFASIQVPAAEPAPASLPTELLECRKEADDARRLACFDREIARAAPSAEQRFGYRGAVARLFQEIADLRQLVPVQCKGLFHQHMLARLQRRQHLFGMAVMAGAQQNRVDGGIGQHRIQIGQRRIGTKTFGGGGGLVAGAVDDGGEMELRHPLQDGQVHGDCEVACPHNREADHTRLGCGAR